MILHASKAFTAADIIQKCEIWLNNRIICGRNRTFGTPARPKAAEKTLYVFIYIHSAQQSFPLTYLKGLTRGRGRSSFR